MFAIARFFNLLDLLFKNCCNEKQIYNQVRMHHQRSYLLLLQHRPRSGGSTTTLEQRPILNRSLQLSAVHWYRLGHAFRGRQQRQLQWWQSHQKTGTDRTGLSFIRNRWKSWSAGQSHNTATITLYIDSIASSSVLMGLNLTANIDGGADNIRIERCFRYPSGNGNQDR